MRRLFGYLRERHGAAAVELALVLPGVLFLLLGGGNLVLVTYATMSLQSATEAGARYASVQTAAVTTAGTGTLPTQSTVSAYAAAHYKGPGIGASFTYVTTGACGTAGNNGNQVSGTGTYHLFYGWGRVPFTIKAQACFP